MPALRFGRQARRFTLINAQRRRYLNALRHLSANLRIDQRDLRETTPDILKRINMETVKTISWDDFEKVDMRAGTIIEVNDFPRAKRPAYKLKIDFGGKLGIRQSSAQITKLYSKEELLNKQVIAVVNFPPKQIADFMSQCLVLGVYDENKDVILLQPAQNVSNGMKVG
jgi:tRNA-binding protein